MMSQPNYIEVLVFAVDFVVFLVVLVSVVVVALLVVTKDIMFSRGQ